MEGNDRLAVEALAGRVVAVLNTGSGSCDAHSEGEALAIFAEADLGHAQVFCVPPPESEAALANAVADADVLVVLGGDGTIRSAAEKCRGLATFLVPLPGGTMNMLPKALYGALAWREALKAVLAAPGVHHVSGGSAGRHSFFVAAILGAPTLWADAREAVREGHIVEAAKRSVTAARRSLSEPLEYEFGDSLAGSAEVVAVVCPLISRAMGEEERAFEAAAFDPTTAAEAFRLGFHALFDDWRDDPSVSRVKTRRVRVTGHGRVPTILDGEKVRLGRTVDLVFNPLAFRALTPLQLAGPAALQAAAG